MQKKRQILWATVGSLLMVGSLLSYLLLYSSGFRNQILAVSRIFADLDISCQRGVPYVPEEKIVIYGDSRDGFETHSQLIRLMLDRKPGVIFNTGDIVNDGEKLTDWMNFNGVTAKMRRSVRFYPVLGNHEKDSSLFYANFELPGNEQWYSINSSGIHFVVLDSNKDISIGSEQYKWLENDLKNSMVKSEFTVLVFHHPPFSTGKHSVEEMHLKKSIVPLFEKYGVDVVFNGHDHNYERSQVKGIYYIVTGGGGAPLYEQVNKSKYSQKFIQTYHYCLLEKTEDSLEISVYNIKDKLVDSVSIKKK